MNQPLKLSLLIAVATLLGISGCGYVSKGLNSDADLLIRASAGTGQPIADLTLVPNSVAAELDKVHYQVQDANGYVYECSFSSIVLSTTHTTCDVISEPAPQPTQSRRRSSSKRKSSAATPSEPSSSGGSGGSDDFQLEGAGHS